MASFDTDQSAIGNTSVIGIPFKCRFNYLKQLVNDEIEFLFLPFYLYIILAYQFWINFSYYVPVVKFIAQLHKAWWWKFVAVFEADAYFRTGWVEGLKVFGIQFLECDILMWKYWVFHLLTLWLPSFSQIDSDINPSPESNWDLDYTQV